MATKHQSTALPATQEAILRGDVAIVGMACMYPGALSLNDLWQNIVGGVDAITDMPPERVPPSFCDRDSAGTDRTYCQRGGFLGPVGVPFDPLQFGIMPILTESGNPEQFLTLKVAHEALRDAGYDPEHLDGSRTEIIIGSGIPPNRGVSVAQYHVGVVNEVLRVLRSLHPEHSDAELAALRERLVASLPRFGPDNAATLVPNFTAARVANRFDCMGTNFTLDAACASSLVALDLGVRDLLTRKCDTAVVGGAFIVSDLTPISVLSQMGALSRTSTIRPFDKDADGTLLGEGVGLLVLKRLEDARRADDRVYAVIKGVGTSSDGRALGLLAPRVEGEELALRRAYDMADLDPATIDLIEAHGTGTPTGDLAEIQALTRVFGTRDPDVPPHCALGTIKSMIGHPLLAAGAAGLIKAALALHQKVLPPTLHCEQPNPKLELERTPFYLNTEARPWIHGGRNHPRRAGVSAFGFGGANAHVVLEEYRDEAEDERPSLLSRWPSEVCVLEAPTRAGLAQRARELADWLAAAAEVDLKDIAYTLNSSLAGESERLAVVAASTADLRGKLERACARLSDATCTQIKDRGGIYYFSQPLGHAGKLALLFPGEGAQYVGMLSDLCQHLPVVRRTLDRIDEIGSLSFVFPPPWPSERERAQQRLWSSVSGAVGSVIAANAAVYALFRRLDLQPDAVMGHSAGDFNACLAAGILSEDERTLDCLSQLWRAYDAPSHGSNGAALLAVGAAVGSTQTQLGELADSVFVANDNCPHQVVLAGPPDIIERAFQRLLSAGIICERLPFSLPYHTQAFAAVSEPLRAFLKGEELRAPGVAIYSCTSADRYPTEPEAIRHLMIEHWSRPVRFQETIRKMYADGVRLFLELGPRGNLTAFVDDILRGEPYLAISADNQRRHGLTQLNHVVGLLTAHGIPLRLDELYIRRSPQALELSARSAPQRSARPEPLLPLTPVRLDPDALTSEQGPVPTNVTASGRAVEAGTSPVEQIPTAAAPARTAGNGHQQPAAPIESGTVVGPHQTRTAQPTEVHPPAAECNGLGIQATNPMIGYLQTMERFLSVQQSVMQAFLQPAGLANLDQPDASVVAQPPSQLSAPPSWGSNDAGLPAPAPSRSSVVAQPVIPIRHAEQSGVDAASYPLLGTLISSVVGQELQAERVLSLATDAFLFDHMLGGRISVDPELRPLAVVPMTVSMEMMAEAAAALLPGLQVVGLRQVRLLRGINVTELPTRLRIEARRIAPEGSEQQVEVAIWSDELGDDSAAESDGPAAQGVVLLAASYPIAPPLAPLSLTNARPCRATVDDIYDWLFHGPQFRMLRSLHQVGDDGITAELVTLPMERFFGDRPSDAMILDPVVLDGAGQLSAAWVFEQLPQPGVHLPVRIDEVTFYGPRYRGRVVLPARLRVLQCEYRQVLANMEIIGPDGRLHIRIAGWQHYRVHTPDHRIRLSKGVRSELAGELWDLPTAPLPAQGRYVAILVDGVSERGSGTLDQACAYLALSRAEREQWRALRGSANRRVQWLLGHIAAKDAVRAYLMGQYGIQLYPADVEVVSDGNGRPRVRGAWAADVPVVPAVSLAHSGTVGVAIAGGAGPDDRIGIDVERIRPRDEGFLELAFSAQERARLDTRDESARWEWATRFWCAKEAVGKAVGHGLVDGPTGVSIEHVDWDSGRLGLTLRGTLERSLPELAGGPVLAYTARAGELVVATTVCEPADTGP